MLSAPAPLSHLAFARLRLAENAELAIDQFHRKWNSTPRIVPALSGHGRAGGKD